MDHHSREKRRRSPARRSSETKHWSGIPSGSAWPPISAALRHLNRSAPATQHGGAVIMVVHVMGMTVKGLKQVLLQPMRVAVVRDRLRVALKRLDA